MWTARILIALVLWGLVPASATSNEVPRLWEILPGDPSASTKPTPQALEGTLVRVNPTFLQNSTAVSLELRRGEHVVIQRIGSHRQPYSSFVWSGADATEEYRAVFSVRNSVVVGDIRAADGSLYRLRHIDGSIHVLERLDRRRFPLEADPLRVRSLVNKSTHSRALRRNEREETSIDLVIFYTVQARIDQGTHDGMLARIDQAMEESQQSFANSNVPIRLRLAHVAELQYSESTSLQFDLEALRDPEDALLDDVHALRSQHAGDIVVLVVGNQGVAGACGMAYQMQQVSSAHCGSAFAVVPNNCMTGIFSFAHELGHVMGADHDIGQNAPPFSFSRGFSNFDPSSRDVLPWKTIMALGDSRCPEATGCERIGYWSSPDIKYKGDATGIANVSDNHMTLNLTRSTVSTFVPSAECP